MDEQVKLQTVKYDPHTPDLQNAISKYLHTKFMQDGRYTLNELGYLHMSTLTAADNQVTLNIYFYPELACYNRVLRNGTTELRVKDIFDILSGYLFVGDIADVVSFTKTIIPQFKIEEDELGRDALYVRNNDKFISSNVMCIKCNLLLTFAALNDINLGDPNYVIDYNKVGQMNTHKSQYIEMEGTSAHPVSATCRFTGGKFTGYDPRQAVPYLTAMAERIRNLNKQMDKLKKPEHGHDEQRKGQNKKNKKNKQSKNNSYSGYNKFG